MPPLSAVLHLEHEQAAPKTEAFDPVREAHHRIANNLTLVLGVLRLEAANVTKRETDPTSGEVRLMLAEIAARIDAVAQLHRMLSAEPQGRVDVAQNLSAMCLTFKPFLSPSSPVEFVTDLCTGCFVHSDQVIPIALIVSEAITNALKYAHPAGVPGRIDVECRTIDGKVVVEVADNGVGLPQDFNVERDGGLGFKVIRTLARQLGAKTVFDSDMLGLRFVLTLQEAQPS